MTAKTVLEYDRPPAVAPSYLRAATTLGGGLGQGETIPRIESSIPGMRPDAKALRDYQKVCGFKGSESLPITYPHVMAFPVHMAVMTHSDFPLKLLGLVHVRNKITQQRALAPDEALDLKVRVGGHRDVHNGVEFDLVTEYFDASKVPVWTGLSTMLSRGKGTGKKSGKKPGSKNGDDDKALEFGRYATWDAPANIGRNYAASAGDYNPIHLSALSAKLFGFPRAIAHGMWLKARTAAQVEGELTQSAYSIEVAFKRPVLLPSSVMLKYNPGKKGIDFLLSDPDGETKHVFGNVTYL